MENKRNLEISDACSICGTEKEDVAYALCRCPQAKNLWSTKNYTGMTMGVFCKTSYTNPPIPKPFPHSLPPLPPLLSRRGFRPELPPEGGGGGGYRRWQRWLKAVAAWRVEPAAGFPPSSQIRWTRRWKAEAARRVDAAAVDPLGGARAVASAALPSGSGEAATSAAGFGTAAVGSGNRRRRRGGWRRRRRPSPPPSSPWCDLPRSRPPILDKEGRRAKGRVKAVLEGGYAGNGDFGGGGGQMRTSDAHGGRRANACRVPLRALCIYLEEVIVKEVTSLFKYVQVG
ncbi:uncharacterized protein LOC127784663 [Oryza glaberrima]|uniref:uncharacterized protein LOC127784663 n=1 Tax=Oryza glaberrima TaxID=4538 RepID=UPI00224C5F93|nr:uncharacterized protein LOC127784663 [Oryza glaberrima]